MAEEAHAELEILDRHALVGGVDQPRRRLDGIARDGKKPYATVPNASRNQWLSVKPATQIGAGLAPGVGLLHPGLHRIPQRRVDRRARAAVRLERLDLVVALAEHVPHDRLLLVRRHPREQPAVDDDVAERRDDVPLLRRGRHRRRQRHRQQRLDHLGERRRDPACTLERVRRATTAPVPVTALEQSLDLRVSCCSGRYAPSAWISGAALTSALSAMPGTERARCVR